MSYQNREKYVKQEQACFTIGFFFMLEAFNLL